MRITKSADADAPARDWIVRDIQPNTITDVSGYGVEVLISDPADQNGKLYTSMKRDEFNSPFSTDAFIPTVPGMRRVGRFNYIKYIPDPLAPNVGKLRVRVITTARCVWSDSDPAGKPRTIFFARNIPGGFTIAPGAAQNFVDFDLIGTFDTLGAGIHPPDRFWTEEVFESRMYWYGWIVGDAAFKVNVFAQNNQNDATEQFHGVQQWTAIDKSAGFSAAAIAACGSVPAATGAFVCDFTTGINLNQTGNTAACRQLIPAGRVRLNCEPIAGAVKFFYMIGAVSHL